jgi:hypothetical protein
MRVRRAVLAALLLTACGEKGGDFEGRVTGSIEGPMRGTAWWCDSPRGATLLVSDERRKVMIAFNGAPGAVKPGAWLLRAEVQPGTSPSPPCCSSTRTPTRSGWRRACAAAR